MNSSGLGTPYWYEWEVGLCKCLEMLYDDNIESVIFQSATFQSIDDVVVNYKDHSSLNIQVKHTDTSSHFTYSFLSNGNKNFLLSWANDWKRNRSTHNIREIHIITNKPWGTNASDGKSSFAHFVNCVFPKLQLDYDYCGSTSAESLAIAWYKAQLKELNSIDAADFTKILSFCQAPGQQELEEAIHTTLQRLCGTDQERAIAASENSLYARLRNWTTSQRKGEEVFREDVYAALCVEENIPKYELFPEKPIFPSRERFAAEFTESIKKSNLKLFVVEGLPGVGKTNFVSYLAQLDNTIVDFRFYTYLPHSTERPYFSDDSGNYSSDLLWTSLLVQLRNEFAKMNLLSSIQFPLFYNVMTVDEKRSTVLKFLPLYVQHTGKPCYIFVDGLDHAARCRDFMSSFIPQLPSPDEIADGVKFVLVSQPITNAYPTWLNRANDQIKFYEMPLLETPDVEILVSYYSISVPQASSHSLAESIIEVVGNNTLNVLFAIQELSRLSSIQTYEEIMATLTERKLNGHISNYYEWIYNSIERTSDSKISVSKLATIFAFTYQEISLEQIKNLADLNLLEAEHYLNCFFPLIQFRHNTYFVMHNDVRLFLKQKILSYNNFGALALFFEDRISKDPSLEELKYTFLFNVLAELPSSKFLAQLFDYKYISNSIKYGVPISLLLNQFKTLCNMAYQNKELGNINSLSMASTTLSQYINCAEYYEKENLFSPPYGYGEKTTSEKYLLDPAKNLEIIVNDINKLLKDGLIERGKNLYDEYFSYYTLIDFLQNDFSSADSEDDTYKIDGSKSSYFEQSGFICRMCAPDILCNSALPISKQSALFSKGWLEAGKKYTSDDDIKTTLSIYCFYAEDLLSYIKDIVGSSAINEKQFGAMNSCILRYKTLPLIATIELCAAEILNGYKDEKICELLFSCRNNIITDNTFSIPSYKIEYFFKLLFCLFQYGLSEHEIKTLYWALLKKCHIAEKDRGFPPAMKLLEISTDVFNAFYTREYDKKTMSNAILCLAYLSNTYGVGSTSDCEAARTRNFLNLVIYHICRKETSPRKTSETVEILIWLFTNEKARYLRELASIFLLAKKEQEFKDVADFWTGSNGRVWTMEYSEVEYICDDIIDILDKFGSTIVSEEIRNRKHLKLLGYSGHKDYSLNDLLQWYQLLPNTKEKLLTYGMQLLTISDTAEDIGDNRFSSSVDSELFDQALLLGPEYIDAFFELKNTVEDFHYWRECLLNAFVKKLPDTSIPDEDLFCIYEIANAWIKPYIEEHTAYNSISFLSDFNYKIAISLSDSSKRNSLLKMPYCTKAEIHDMHAKSNTEIIDLYAKILAQLSADGYSANLERAICDQLAIDSGASYKTIRFLLDAGSIIKEECMPEFVSKCITPYIIANSDYGLEYSGLKSLIKQYSDYFSYEDWLKLFQNSVSGEFSVSERNFYYINGNIETLNLYYSKSLTGNDLEELFSQRVQMHMHWITAGGLISCPTYELKLDKSILSLKDFVRKHIGI